MCTRLYEQQETLTNSIQNAILPMVSLSCVDISCYQTISIVIYKPCDIKIPMTIWQTVIRFRILFKAPCVCTDLEKKKIPASNTVMLNLVCKMKFDICPLYHRDPSTTMLYNIYLQDNKTWNGKMLKLLLLSLIVGTWWWHWQSIILSD